MNSYKRAEFAFTTATLAPVIVASGMSVAETADASPAPGDRIPSPRFLTGWTRGNLGDDSVVFLTGDILNLKVQAATARVGHLRRAG